MIVFRQTIFQKKTFAVAEVHVVPLRPLNFQGFLGIVIMAYVHENILQTHIHAHVQI